MSYEPFYVSDEPFYVDEERLIKNVRAARAARNLHELNAAYFLLEKHREDESKRRNAFINEQPLEQSPKSDTQLFAEMKLKETEEKGGNLRDFFNHHYVGGQIYQLKDGDECVYVGQTINALSTRLEQHISAYKNRKHKRDHLTISLLEKYPSYNKSFLSHREQYWIDKLKPKLNKATAYAGFKTHPPKIDYAVLENTFDRIFWSDLAR